MSWEPYIVRGATGILIDGFLPEVLFFHVSDVGYLPRDRFAAAFA